MKNLNEEINKMKHLFNFKKGDVITESLLRESTTDFIEKSNIEDWDETKTESWVLNKGKNKEYFEYGKDFKVEVLSATTDSAVINIKWLTSGSLNKDEIRPWYKDLVDWNEWNKSDQIGFEFKGIKITKGQGSGNDLKYMISVDVIENPPPSGVLVSGINTNMGNLTLMIDGLDKLKVNPY